jgi:phosphoenolpyruvate synthase/pyruvate phosphate dikinase
VIEASAFAAFVDASSLRERIADRLAGLDVDCRDEVDQAAADIRLGFDRGDIDAAVIVQRQVNPTRSGFMATGATDDDAPDRLVVEAIYGLGEAAISGLVVPDRFAVDKSSLGILGKEVHHKGLVVEERPPDGGTRQRCVSGEQADRAALLDSEIREIARVGAQVEDHFGGPQVIEWALDRDGRVWVLQSCPLDSASLEQRCAVGLGR